MEDSELGCGIVAATKSGNGRSLGIGQALTNAPGMQAIPIIGGLAIAIKRYGKVRR
ncbi:MAG: hypothetical protein HC772_14190 [Leptolyngbyaceae cyanobacterium CRU_2_3]|nr:hypothetical protein [Leptolyngbyaceae cyanobacterium CRU_2_3]